METKINLKNWALDDRPREKLMNKGICALSDAELIAILIGSGNKNETAVELSRRILLDNKSNLNELGKLSVKDLIKYKGIGEAKAISIVAALELGKRRISQELVEKPQISSSKDVFNIMSPILSDLKQEEFWVLVLNNSSRILSKKKISQGGITSTTVDIRNIMQIALENAIATSIILIHNHPSENKQPSESDIKLTEMLYNASKIMNIRLLDHLIICSKEYFSFADNALVIVN